MDGHYDSVDPDEEIEDDFDMPDEIPPSRITVGGAEVLVGRDPNVQLLTSS
jgi:hypothetical protein